MTPVAHTEVSDEKKASWKHDDTENVRPAEGSGMFPPLPVVLPIGFPRSE